MTRSTYKGLGVAPGLDANLKGLGDRMNRFVGETFTKTASTPDGYGMKGYVPPLKAGSMSCLAKIADVAGTGNALAGGPMIGTASVCEFTGESGLSMVVSMSANVAMVTFSADNLVLALTIGLSGTAEWTLTGTSSLSMIVPIEGSGSVASMTGTSDLRGILSMAGEWTPFTELSPQGLASAVWNSLLTEYQTTGSAGKALSTASSGGVDLVAMAQAILDAAQVTPIHADTRKMNGAVVAGVGTSGDKWRGV
jgi:hypothetical protein